MEKINSHASPVSSHLDKRCFSQLYILLFALFPPTNKAYAVVWSCSHRCLPASHLQTQLAAPGCTLWQGSSLVTQHSISRAQREPSQHKWGELSPEQERTHTAGIGEPLQRGRGAVLNAKKASCNSCSLPGQTVGSSETSSFLRATSRSFIALILKGLHLPYQ